MPPRKLPKTRREYSEYGPWAAMLSRCRNPNVKHYKNYGGRGVTVDPRWCDENGFENFLEDMGPRPSPQHTIERKKNELGYSKDNCVWATRSEQANNKRNNRVITANGETRTAAEWSALTGLPVQTILWRLRNNATPERAVLPEPIERRHYPARNALGAFTK